MEKLNELVDSGDFDVVVVDTPPTRNALDLLDAPRRLTRFLENRLFRALLLPTRMSLRAVGVATQALLRTISKVAGAEIVQDAVAFFQAFEGMEEGFRTRAGAVRELLADPGHGLRAGDLGPARRRRRGQLLRREAGRARHRRRPPWWSTGSTPASGRPTTPAARPTVAGPAGRPGGEPGRPQRRWPARGGGSYAALAAQVAPAPVGRIPLFGHDVHDLGGLRRAADVLFGSTATRAVVAGSAPGYRTPPAVR